MVNSNSTSAVQDPSSGGELKLYLGCTGYPSSGGELKLYLGCTGSKLRWRTQTLPRLYRIQAQVVNSNSTSAVQDPSSGGELKLYLGCTGYPSSGGELKLYLGCTGSKLRWRTQTLPRLYRIQAQVVNSNSTSAVQDPSSGGELKLYLGCTGYPSSGGELKLYLGCTGSKLRW